MPIHTLLLGASTPPQLFPSWIDTRAKELQPHPCRETMVTCHAHASARLCPRLRVTVL